MHDLASLGIDGDDQELAGAAAVAVMMQATLRSADEPADPCDIADREHRGEVDADQEPLRDQVILSGRCLKL